MTDRTFWLILFSVLVAMTVPLWIHPPRESSVTASWVQAYGSVVAIFVSIWIAREGDRKKRREETEAAIVSAQFLAVSLDETATELDSFRERWFHVVVEIYSREDRLKSLAIAPVELESISLPSEDQLLRLITAPPSVLKSVLVATREVVSLRQQVASIAQMTKVSKESWADALGTAANIEDQHWIAAIKKIRDACESLQAFAGGNVSA